MKLFLLLTSLGCYSYISLPIPPSSNTLYCPSLIQWRERDAYCVLRYMPPTLHASTSCSCLLFIKHVIGIMMSFQHATALRLLLIISGDVEQNPGPIDNLSKPTTSTAVVGPHSESSNKSDASKMKCFHCSQKFKWYSDLRRHINTQHSDQAFACDSCSYRTKRKDNLKRHARRAHPASDTKKTKLNPSPEANLTENVAAETESVLHDMITTVSKRSVKKKQALNGEIKVYKITRPGENKDIEMFLNDTVGEIEGYINEELSTRTGIKLLLNPHIEMFKPVHPEEITKVYFSHKPITIYRESVIAKELRQVFPSILKAVDEFTREGSGWAISAILAADLHLARLGLMRGSSYHKLPKELAKKKAMVNVKNNDNKCFMWAVLAKLHPIARNPNRVRNYKPYEHELDFADIPFPIMIKDITKVEVRNGLAINLYGYDDEVGLHPLRMSKQMDNRWIHLLLYEGHYSLIKNLDRLLFDQRGGHRRKYFCPRCLTAKYSAKDRKSHYDMCCQEDPTKIVMPTDNQLKFTNLRKMLRQPLVLYADFECLTVKVDGPQRGNTTPYQQHVPCGYGLVSVSGCCGDTKIGKPTLHRGNDCVKRFFTDVAGHAAEYQETLKQHEDYRTIEMTTSDWIVHCSNTCHICNEEIPVWRNAGDDIKVRDHCHFCGKYRGPAHSECNREYRKNRDIVVILHNLRKYDSHLLMQEIGGAAKLNGWELSVVAKTMEDYISFSLIHIKEVEEKKGADELGDESNVKDITYKIKFIDSFQFMNRSLAELVGNLDKDKFLSMRQEFSGVKLELLLRKGVYPYDYMDCWEKFNERMIPRKRDFYSKLNDERVSDEDYRHVMTVWKTFDIRNLGQYHDLYLETDVLLLADVFEEFRKISKEAYGLDPCHYMTAPSLTWDACLKMMKVNLELLQDPDMYMFFEHGIRGGISQISHRYARANNIYIPETYDSSKPNTYIMYLDANNLYGYAMVQSMPINSFKWMDKEDIEEICWLDVPDDYEMGYILEVDLKYPADLHDTHASYPLAPEHMTITDVSPYCQQLRENLGLKTPPTRKLVTTLADKKHYIIHYRSLKLYLSLGMELTKIHRAISFKQSKWMEPYIMSNTQKRTVARNAFEKDFYKLMNNAAFGKTMEDVRKYKNVELVTSDVRHRKLVASPRYKSSAIFTKDLVGVCSLRASTCLNKPIYCGFSVLELSKELMYQFHYKYIMPKYGSNAQLLFTDTDSLCYVIETGDIYKDMVVNAELFDFSDYPKDHALHSTTNKKVIGKMKDETAGSPIIEFCGLRSKMYSILEKNKEKKTAKGIKKAVVKKIITHQDYVNTLFEERPMVHSMNLIQSRNHNLETVTMKKKSLSPYDDKRWLLDNVKSLPYGHYSLVEKE